MRHIKYLAFALTFAACSADLPHESPYDALSPADKQAGASLSGRVTLEGESDFSQISIKLSGPAHTYSTDTESDGRVTFTGIVPGRYALRVASRYFESVTREAVIEVGATFDLGTLELKARRTAVTGLAQAQLLAGKSLVTKGGVEVTLTRKATARHLGLKAAAAVTDTADSLVFSAVSGADGRYRFGDVPAGVYTLTAVRDDLPPVTSADIEVTGEDGPVEAAGILIKPASGFLDVVGSVRGQPNARLTQVGTVTLRLAGFNAAQMQIGSAPGNDVTACVPGAAAAFAPSATITLGVEGPYVFCAVFLDDAGRPSAPAYGAIVYDKTPPMLPSVVINAGAAYLTGSLATLSLSAIDATAGVETMYVSEDSALAGATARDFVPALVFPLASGEGAHTVYARFEDAAGNATAIVSSGVVVDTLPPTVAAFDLHDGAGAPVSLANATRVYASLDAADASPLQMLISNYSDYRGSAWQPYQPLLAWDLVPPGLPGGEARTVYAKVRDAAGHETPAGAVGVWVDTQAPSNPYVALAASLVTQTTVGVTLSAGAADFVELSTDIGFLAPIRFSYQTVTSVTFAAGDGTKTLFARFSDAAGNVSALAAASLTLDQTPPENPAFAISEASPLSVNVVHLTLAATGASEMAVSDGACQAAWEPYAQTKAFALATTAPGTHTIAVRFRDAAGNVTPCLTRAVVYDAVAPVATAPLRIESGAARTASRTVSLEHAVTGATEMQISEYSSFIDAAWQPYVALSVFTLSAGDGSKTLYFRARDAAGNLSLVQSAAIVLDTTAPGSPYVSLAAALVTQPTVSVTLSAVNADFIELSTDIGFLAPIRFAYQTVTTVTFAAGDGTKTLFARFIDSVGNVSSTAAASTVLDQTPPENPAFTVAEPSPTNLALLHLTLAATGAHDMSVSEGACLPAWEPYAQAKSFALATTAAGTHTIAVWFKDAAGNATACLTRAVVYDATSPAATAAFAIEGGAARTPNRTVALQHAVTGATEMEVSEYAAFVDAAWHPFVPTSSFTLSAGDGAKTLYFRARDAAGNLSLVQSAAIVLDTAAPSFNALSGAALVSGWQADLALSAAGADRMRISEDPLFTAAAWVPFAAVTTVTLSPDEGVKSVYAQLADLAGNLSVVRSIDVAVDATPPGAPAVTLLEGAYTRTASLTVQTLSDGASEMRLAQTAAFTGAVWQPLASLRTFTLAGGDGAYRVYLQVRDAAHNESSVVSAAVTLDTSAPLVTRFEALSAAGLAIAATSQTQLTLALDVTDASPVQAQFNTSNLFGGVALEPVPAFFLRRAWTVIPPSNPLGELRSVYVRVTDLAGNETQAGPLDVWIDSLGPTSPDLALPALANAVTVPVSLFAQNADWAELSEDPAFLIASRFAMRAATTYTFTNDGAHTLYVRYADNQGNYSAAAAAQVEIDTTPPVALGFTIREAPMTPQLTIHVTVDALDAEQMQISESTCGGAWTPYSTTAAYNFQAIFDGMKWVTLRLRDAAGNLSPCYATAITLDSGAPAITSLLPRSGRPGNDIAIFGNNFGNAAGYVILDGLRVPVSTSQWSSESWANTEIHSYVPQADGRGLVQLRVEAGGKVSGDVPFFLFPIIQGYDVYSVDEGDTVTMNGHAFGRAQAGAQITVGDLDAPITGWSPTAITFTVPAYLTGEGSVPVKLIADGYTTQSGLGLKRVITGMSPSAGTDGTVVTVSGRGFGPLPGWAYLFGDSTRQLTILSWSSRQIQFAVSSQGYRGPLTISLFTNVGYDIGVVQFTQTGPVLLGRTPAEGTGAVTIKLVGEGFGVTQGTVTVGGVPAAVTSWTDQVVYATTDAGVRPGVRDIVLTDAAGARSGPLPYVAKGVDAWYTPLAFTPRKSFSAVWTGAEFIVFGGTSLTTGEVLADGARYNPATDDWVMIPLDPTDTNHIRTAGPHTGHIAVWNGTRMFLFGGSMSSSCPCNGASSSLAYVPSANQWLPTTFWGTTNVGASMGVSPQYVFSVGGRDYWGNPAYDSMLFNLVTGDYSYAYDTVSGTDRQGASVVWDGSRFLIFGGTFSTPKLGVAYWPETGDWEGLEQSGQPAARADAMAAWTGSEMLVWGGKDSTGTALGDGARYNPQTSTWAPIAAAGAPSSRFGASALWIGSSWYVWGGSHDGTLTGDGALYDPAADSWSPMSATGAPAPRTGHAAVWTGTHMYVWGADLDNTGGRYDPVADAWAPMRAAPVRDPYGETIATAYFGLPAWSGSEAFWWNPNLGRGVRYTAATDRTSPLPATGGVLASTVALAWAGDRLVAWQTDGVDAAGATYVPGDGYWTPMTTAGRPAPRNWATMLGAPDLTAAVVWGGYDTSWNPLSDGLVYNAAADTWDTISAPPQAPDSQYTVLYADGSLYLYGGYDASAGYTQSNLGLRYDLTTGLWTVMSRTGAPKRGNVDDATFAPDAGGFFVWGGYDSGSSSYAPVLYRYDAGTDSWSSFAPPVGLTGLPTLHAFVTPMDGRLLIHHGGAFPDPVTQAAIFDPGTLAWRPVALGDTNSASGYSFSAWDGAKVELWLQNGDSRPLFYLPPP